MILYTNKVILGSRNLFFELENNLLFMVHNINLLEVWETVALKMEIESLRKSISRQLKLIFRLPLSLTTMRNDNLPWRSKLLMM